MFFIQVGLDFSAKGDPFNYAVTMVTFHKCLAVNLLIILGGQDCLMAGTAMLS